jgi:hypothetical protein
MALWSLFVDVEGYRFSSQARGDTPREAVSEFFTSGSVERHSKNALSFGIGDIVLLVPMTPLVNMHLCQAGRDGKYVSIIMALTVEGEV